VDLRGDVLQLPLKGVERPLCIVDGVSGIIDGGVLERRGDPAAAEQVSGAPAIRTAERVIYHGESSIGPLAGRLGLV
jgi:hypothetical protein